MVAGWAKINNNSWKFFQIFPGNDRIVRALNNGKLWYGWKPFKNRKAFLILRISFKSEKKKNGKNILKGWQSVGAQGYEFIQRWR